VSVNYLLRALDDHTPILPTTLLVATRERCSLGSQFIGFWLLVWNIGSEYWLCTMSEVDTVIEDACQTTMEKAFQANGLALRRANADDIPRMQKLMSGDKALQPRHHSCPNKTQPHDVAWNQNSCRLDVPNFFALLVEESKTSEKLVGFLTFYLAYSTWDARVLYLDKLFLDTDDDNDRDAIEWSMHFTLADIAVRLNCARYTWQVRVWPSPRFPGLTDAHLFVCFGMPM
jgi:hypothetical protein